MVLGRALGARSPSAGRCSDAGRSYRGPKNEISQSRAQFPEWEAAIGARQCAATPNGRLGRDSSALQRARLGSGGETEAHSLDINAQELRESEAMGTLVPKPSKVAKLLPSMGLFGSTHYLYGL